MQAYLSGRKAHNYRLLEASFLNCSARLRVCEAVFRKALQSSSTNRPLPPLTYKPACGLPFQYAWTRSVVQSLSKSRFPALPVSVAQPAGLFWLRHIYIPGRLDESLSTNLRLLGLAGQINHYQAFIGDERRACETRWRLCRSLSLSRYTGNVRALHLIRITCVDSRRPDLAKGGGSQDEVIASRTKSQLYPRISLIRLERNS